MNPLQLTLEMLVERYPSHWSISRLTATIATERPEQFEVWGSTVAVYRLNPLPYGENPHGLLGFRRERHREAR